MKNKLNKQMFGMNKIDNYRKRDIIFLEKNPIWCNKLKINKLEKDYIINDLKITPTILKFLIERKKYVDYVDENLEFSLIESGVEYYDLKCLNDALKGLKLNSKEYDNAKYHYLCSEYL